MSNFKFRNSLREQRPDEGCTKEFAAYQRDYLKARLFMEKFLKKYFGECCYDREEYFCEHCHACKAYKNLDLIYDNPYAK